jgi:hypothetical protein
VAHRAIFQLLRDLENAGLGLAGTADVYGILRGLRSTAAEMAQLLRQLEIFVDQECQGALTDTYDDEGREIGPDLAAHLAAAQHVARELAKSLSRALNIASYIENPNQELPTLP